MQPKPSRPTGVTILAILAILVGIGGLVGGVFLIGLGIAIGVLVTSADIANAVAAAGYPGFSSLSVGIISGVVIALGVVALLMGILYLATGIGFFGGKGWAWSLGMIVAVIGVILAIVQIAFGNWSSILSLIIGGLILYFLTRPHVKSFFGKGAPMGTTMGTPTSPPQ